METAGATQEQIHDAIAPLVCDDGEVLTGWISCYETQQLDGAPQAGHYYGPATMTAWGALGLIEWARTVTLPDSRADDDDGD